MPIRPASSFSSLHSQLLGQGDSWRPGRQALDSQLPLHSRQPSPGQQRGRNQPPAQGRRGQRAGLLASALVAGLLLSSCSQRQRPEANSLGVYSGRHYNTDQQLYRQFEARTGIKVKLLEGKDDALIERLRSEGSSSPADVLVLVDAARLAKAAEAGLFRPIDSAALRREVPANLRDSKQRWFALTRRVRAVVVNPTLVPPASIRSYADLASPALRGKLCLRNGLSVYNQSLVADQLIQRGEAATKAWLQGLVANLGQPFFTSDIPLARAVGQGRCGVGLVNTYYVARMLSGKAGADDQAAARKLKLILPDPAHVNISGAGVTASSRNVEAGRRLIEFLASPSGGHGYAEANNEYPLTGTGSNPILKGFGPFRDDGVSAEAMGARNKQAVLLMRAAGWS
ncbi:MAG: extracellular solute-binding protein [Synechococcaceae cyanobacterium ELA263]